MSTTAKERAEVMIRLSKLGINAEDAAQLRRIAMTLWRWFELECGDGNDHASWCIARGYAPEREFYHDPITQAPQWQTVGKFIYDDMGSPYIETHNHNAPEPYYRQIPDRENGARKRLVILMRGYPQLRAYIQNDPRGASLYILTKQQLGKDDIESVYSRGVAVY